MERNEAIEVVKKNYPHVSESDAQLETALRTLVPELAESEDERIRKEIIKYIKTGTYYKSWINWLEKQGEKEVDPRRENLEELLAADAIYQMSMNEEMVEEAKSKAINALSELQIGKLLGLEKQGESNPYSVVSFEYNDHIWGMCARDNGVDILFDCKLIEHLEIPGEPKFEVGNWITDGENTWKIEGIRQLDYLIRSQNGDVVNATRSYVDENFHLWTIEDAKDGDIIYLENTVDTFDTIKIFSKLEGERIYGYCDIWSNDEKLEYWRFDNKSDFIRLPLHNIFPATKKQRDRLFKLMKEAGYKWDFDKKSLSNGIFMKTQ